METLSTMLGSLQIFAIGELGTLGDLALALAAALVAGGIAFRLGQPVLIGYLLAGTVIGPYALGLVRDVDSVQSLADIGVAFLMFVLAVEFPLGQLRRVQAIAIVGGGAQVVLTIAVGLAIGLSMALNLAQAAFFGSIIALSSTTVVLKILSDRDELDTLYGRIMIGLLIIQDLSVVPMMVILPTLAEPRGAIAVDLLIAVAKAALVLVVVLYLGIRLLPKALLRVAATQSHELFLLAVVALILGTAIIAYLMGLSLAFGAFISGLVVSESYLSHEILAELRPLRDLFATLFFVSVGMLINPAFVLANAAVVVFVVLAVVVVKFLLCTAITLSFRYPGRVAVLVGLGLIQIGEFSFVLARLGVERGMLTDFLYSLTLSTALVTILFTPGSLRMENVVSSLLSRIPMLARSFEEPPALIPKEGVEAPSQHVVICGYGRVGRILGRVLAARKFKYFVIDYDPHVVEYLRSRGVSAIYGDASHLPVLAQANLGKARALVLSIPDPIVAELAIGNALRINPRLDIIVRAHRDWAIRLLRTAGATEIVQPEFEAGLEMVYHTLRRFGISSIEIRALLAHLREEYYQTAEEELPFE
ncbi:MAG: cation:proton antiporter [Dehalococcoidales bacterium]|nr:cation:proton antiporter [Dehalococcoidales bacterium]